MRLRYRKSAGQALILVTLALMAMCGMMGLAVDLGWSFFVQKEAQASADAAALAAVTEAAARISSTFGFSCPGSPAGQTSVYCHPAAVDCTSAALGGTDTNLWNGCLYAQRNGFTPAGLGGRQLVKIQANDGQAGHLPEDQSPPTAIGVKDIAYWATVRTTQTIPQLFSAVIGRTEGIVSAVATAGLVSVIVPGSFIALNEEGDCISSRTNPQLGFIKDCGVDVDLQGSGNAGSSPSPNCPGSSSPATLCAANGIILSSTCDGTNRPNCGGNERNYAGMTGGGADVYSSSTQVRKDANYTGAVNDPTKWTPPPASTATPSLFEDPTKEVANGAQPRIAASGGAPIATCGIPNGLITGGNGNSSPLILGPYQYYAVDRLGVPTGNKIVLTGNVQFRANGSCSNNSSSNTAVASGAANPYSTQVPAYLFYGGLQAGGHTDFGAGQYVMVGTNVQVENGSNVAASFTFGGSNGQPTVTGDSAVGTQFITTAPSYDAQGAITIDDNPSYTYPGLMSQMVAIPGIGNMPRLYQGYIDLKTGNAASVTLYGLNRNSLTDPNIQYLGDYNGNLFWQDRRNSTVVYNPDTADILSYPCANGTCTNVNALPDVLHDNGVTFTSPQLNYAASAPMSLNGNIYQPRGAWLQFGPGNPNITSALQVITGMIRQEGGGQVELLPTARPLISYKPALIH